jgi:hypothetical protein
VGIHGIRIRLYKQGLGVRNKGGNKLATIRDNIKGVHGNKNIQREKSGEIHGLGAGKVFVKIHRLLGVSDRMIRKIHKGGKGGKIIRGIHLGIWKGGGHLGVWEGGAHLQIWKGRGHLGIRKGGDHLRIRKGEGLGVWEGGAHLQIWKGRVHLGVWKGGGHLGIRKGGGHLGIRNGGAHLRV